MATFKTSNPPHGTRTRVKRQSGTDTQATVRAAGGTTSSDDLSFDSVQVGFKNHPCARVLAAHAHVALHALNKY